MSENENIRCAHKVHNKSYLMTAVKTFKGQLPVSGMFRAGRILDSLWLLSRNYLFIFREIFFPANNRISARSGNSTDWKSAFWVTLCNDKIFTSSRGHGTVEMKRRGHCILLIFCGTLIDSLKREIIVFPTNT